MDEDELEKFRQQRIADLEKDLLWRKARVKETELELKMIKRIG